MESTTSLEAARDEFVAGWGALGSAWGINRTMAQIHALLLTSTRPLSTDEIMENLQISRGNAHGNIRELVGWTLLRSIIKKGERKEFFEAEKDVWKIACTIARERKRREIEPALEILRSCSEQTKNLKDKESKAFHAQITELRDFVTLSGRALESAAKTEQSKILKVAARFIS